MIEKLQKMFDVPYNFNTSMKEMPSSKIQLDTPINIEVKSLDLTMFEIRETLNHIGSLAYVKTTCK